MTHSLEFVPDVPWIQYYDKLVRLVEAAQADGKQVSEADVKVSIHRAGDDVSMTIRLEV